MSFFSLELFFDFLMIIVTGTYAYFAFNQWKAIDKQANLMAEQLESMRQSSVQTQQMIEATQKMAEQNRLLVETVQRVERPYIALKDTMMTNFAVGQSPIFTANIINAGGTPAYNLTVESFYSFRVVPFTGRLEYIKDAEKNVAEFLVINVAMNIVFTPTLVLTSDKLEAIRNKKALLFFYGRGSYESLGRTYPLRYCYVYNADLSILALCDERYLPQK